MVRRPVSGMLPGIRGAVRCPGRRPGLTLALLVLRVIADDPHHAFSP